MEADLLRVFSLPGDQNTDSDSDDSDEPGKAEVFSRRPKRLSQDKAGDSQQSSQRAKASKPKESEFKHPVH